MMSTSISIREAVPADDDAIWGALRPAVEAGDVFCAPRDGGRSGAFAYWRPPGARNYVAEIDGRIVGTFYVRANQTGGGSHVANAGYCTHPDAAGRGVARAMLEFSLDEARGLGFEAMQYNFVLATNTRAIDTWMRAGFAEIGRIPRAFRLPNGSYTDALILHRFL